MSHQSYTLFPKLQATFLFIQKNGSSEVPVPMNCVADYLKVTPRDVRHIVSTLRLLGVPVVNSFNSKLGGYFIPTTNAQVEDWKSKSLNKLIRSRRLIYIASTYQPQMPGLEQEGLS